MKLFEKISRYLFDRNKEVTTLAQEYDPDILIKDGIFYKKNPNVSIHHHEDGYFQPLIVNNCEFFFNEIYFLKGVIVGELGSQVYQLNSDGVPVSDGMFPEEFEPLSILLEVGESDYFEDYAEKTYQIGNRFILGDGLSEFFGVKKHSFSALFSLVDKEHNPIFHEGKQLDVHELYLKDDNIIASKGNSYFLLNKDGQVEKTGIGEDFLQNA